MHAEIDVALQAGGVLVADPGSGNPARVTGFFLVVEDAVEVTFKNAAGSANILPPLVFAGPGGITVPFNPDGWALASDGISVVLSADVQVSGVLTYRTDRSV